MRTKLFVALLSGLTALMATPIAAQAKGGPPPPPPSGNFSCRASIVRVVPAGLLNGVINPIELFVANPAGDPCVDDNGGLLNAPVTVDGGPTLSLSADLLVSRTDDGAEGVAHAGVANLALTVLGQTISASILSAEATAGPCPATSLQSESDVLSLSVNGVNVDVPLGQQHVSVGITVAGAGVLTLELNSTITTSTQVTQRALWLHSDLIGDVIVGEAVADVHGNPCGQPGKPPKQIHGFMTGGGSIDSPVGKVTHGSHLECIASEGPNNLQVNWGGNHFHLESVTSTKDTCSDDPSINPGQPAATFDTIEGDGVGRCNGASASAHWKLTDAGEPGRGDRFEVTITGSNCNLTAAGFLTGGNQQAHSKV